ncbi:hypothetical protein HNR06_002911 [Nocardiopsis arvandica]|uniref:Uncharacterized protein n=1 Tax=Nocardiopsis sinuspersici TaxID=501010 RepID=A0A7Y9XEG3_9ACTN|nr:flagellar associated protein [Nocardiopsis sinuspersici]NYH53322.1 hypothetical protein [Nocardiopsis sinuspersici]
MPRTSRTAGAMRAAAAVCPPAPSLLLLPLVVGAVLTALWLLGAAPASADEGLVGDGPGGVGALRGDPAGTGSPPADGSPEDGVLSGEAPGDGVLDDSAPDGGAPQGHGAPDGGTLGLRDSAALKGVVPGEVAEPVVSTLGSVHHRLEEGAERTAAGTAAVLPRTAWGVGEVGEGARQVIRELDRTDGTVENALAPVARAATGPSGPADLGDASGADRRPAGHERSEGGATDHGTSHETFHGHSPGVVFGAFPSADSAVPSGGPTDHDSGAPAPAAPAGQLSTGSAAPTGGSAPAPGVAGYLTAAPSTAPAAGAVPLAAHALHPVPGGPSDDPTVSPD